VGSVSVEDASGRGSLSLGGTVAVNEIAAHVITFADLAHYVGADGIRRVHQQGWYGVGFAGTIIGVSMTWLSFWKYIEVESFTSIGLLHDTVPADTLYWDIQAGGVMYLEVDW